MRRTLLAATALMGLVATSIAAQAAPITGQISFGGPVSYSTSGNTTSIDFGASAGVTPSTASGSFSPGFTAGCLNCATFTDFSYTGTGAVTPFQLYTATLNGLVTTFTLNAVTFSEASSNFVNMAASGILTLTGYDDTPGTFTFSTQPGQQNTTVSFSATGSATAPTAVPEPASLALFGAGLLGLGLVRRARSRSV